MHTTDTANTPETAEARTVLLVEDDPTFRRLVTANLRRRGAAVWEAANVGEAISLLRRAVPDLILRDINLPDSTGWDVLRDLALRGVSVPAVVVSAVQVSPARLREFPTVRYLPKPFPLDGLLNLVFNQPLAGSADQLTAAED